MKEEIELKLALAPENAAVLQRHALLRKLKHRRMTTKHIVSVYYDTPDLTLQQNKVTLRIRKSGRDRIQTIKCDALPGKSMLVRGEWEQRISGELPEPSKLDVPELRALIDPHHGNGALKPVFVTDVVRRTWPLKVGDREIECALDVGEIKTDGSTQPLCEVELELKAGDRAGLFELARQLNQAIPLRIERSSKAARGYRLIAGTSPPPQPGEPVELNASMTVRATFVAIVRRCLDHILANVDSAHDGNDPEGVHQLRVGMRRLRAALSLFQSVVPEQDRLSLGAELRWLAQELGPAREWDVLIETIFAQLPKHVPTGDGMRRFRELAEAHRAEGYKRTRAVLAEPRYTDLLLRLEAWIDRMLPSGTPASVADGEQNPLDQPIIGFAAEVLRIRHKKVEQLGKRHRKLDPEQLHRLRIQVKKLRYATEFFRGLWPKKAAVRYIRTLKGLQGVLGTANDAIVAVHLVASLEAEAGAGLEREAGLIHGWAAAHLKQDRKALARLWDRFAASTAFWKVPPRAEVRPAPETSMVK